MDARILWAWSFHVQMLCLEGSHIRYSRSLFTFLLSSVHIYHYHTKPFQGKGGWYAPLIFPSCSLLPFLEGRWSICIPWLRRGWGKEEYTSLPFPVMVWFIADTHSYVPRGEQRSSVNPYGDPFVHGCSTRVGKDRTLRILCIWNWGKEPHLAPRLPLVK